MSTPKNLVIATLRQLRRQCVKDQMRLKVLRKTRLKLVAQLLEEEDKVLQSIRASKQRMNRELLVSGPMLGISLAENGDEDEED